MANRTRKGEKKNEQKNNTMRMYKVVWNCRLIGGVADL